MMAASVSPCLTPTVVGISTSTSPTAIRTVRSVCSMRMSWTRCSGTPYRRRMPNIIERSTESNALTRSTYSVHVPSPCSFLLSRAILSEKTPSAQPLRRMKPFWYSTPTLERSVASLSAMIEPTTFATASSSMIPRQFDGSLASPFFGSSLSRPTRHSSKHVSAAARVVPRACPDRQKSKMVSCTSVSVSSLSVSAWKHSTARPLSPGDLPVFAFLKCVFTSLRPGSSASSCMHSRCLTSSTALGSTSVLRLYTSSKCARSTSAFSASPSHSLPSGARNCIGTIGLDWSSPALSSLIACQ
mmetsp:Transcript_26166/g.61208  ORF Transcript_26166/g.61208 Transcript_26166/m.61208 type:complete len:300 (+) Transcript_26166:1221-2120(+)